ncbi:cold-shock protein [Shewanella intestini]|uniref:Cold shock domain-containing protein n=1 Tax=Shewanella intestini TaxID=2017544 RepID=A0ABS5I384_9GAMM|nr:cold shock domain-containing protein [Shewanella sp. XMDDZSB0408]MBR9728497.1 cold shock domain-containing protein [Shewanella intestini]MRG36316.1 cold shock domain-containing protein [Shewanella sp. XMDDZSB0408]
MKGEIISYMSSKKYGFVRGDDNESYFLHISSLIDPSLEPQLVKGVFVEFEPTPTPKGIAAKQVSLYQSYFIKTLSDFIITKHKTPKLGTIEVSHPVVTRFFKCPNEGRNYIKQLAEKADCNAVLNLRYEKQTFAKGNYRYTVHAYKADLAIVTELFPCQSKQNEQESFNEVDKKINHANATIPKLLETENDTRENQLKRGPGLVKVIVALAAVGLVAAMVS